MGSMSITHWLIVLAVILLVFGTGKLKNIGKDMGGIVRDLKEGFADAKEAKAEIERLK